MARANPHTQVSPSLLDLLLDPNARGAGGRHGYGVADMLRAVNRDLEDLLNTRQTLTEEGRAYPEVAHSVAGYGLPDLSTLDALNDQQRQEIAKRLTEVISCFEPRLTHVTVPERAIANKDRQRRVRIEAKLNLNPAAPVAFDTVLELTTGHYTVQQADP